MKGEDDYRMIFENFVNDLLLTVNKPEWPAAEVMLSLLGSLLVQQFNNKSLDQSVRVASVDYLGTIASTLRRDAVMSQLKENDIDAVIRDLLDEDEDEDDGDEEQEGMKQIKHEDIDFNNNNNLKSEYLCDNEVKFGSDSQSTGFPNLVDGPDGMMNKSEGNGFSNSDRKIEEMQKSKSKRTMIGRSKLFNPISQLDRVQSLRDAILDYLAAEESSPTAVVSNLVLLYRAYW